MSGILARFKKADAIVVPEAPAAPVAPLTKSQQKKADRAARKAAEGISTPAVTKSAFNAPELLFKTKTVEAFHSNFVKELQSMKLEGCGQFHLRLSEYFSMGRLNKAKKLDDASRQGMPTNMTDAVATLANALYANAGEGFVNAVASNAKEHQKLGVERRARNSELEAAFLAMATEVKTVALTEKSTQPQIKELLSAVKTVVLAQQFLSGTRVVALKDLSGVEFAVENGLKIAFDKAKGESYKKMVDDFVDRIAADPKLAMDKEKGVDAFVKTILPLSRFGHIKDEAQKKVACARVEK